MTVEYRTIERLPGYRFGSDGSVWSNRWKGPCEVIEGDWRKLKPAVSTVGYLKATLTINKVKQYHLAHRLILEAFVGPCPTDMEACHNNGNRQDNRIENLRWDTRSNNIQDALRHGTFRNGSQHRWSKLTEDEVREVRRLHRQGHGLRAMGRRFGVKKTAIQGIVHNRTWRWFESPLSRDKSVTLQPDGPH